MTLVKKTKERREVGLVEGVFLRIHLANLRMILVHRRTGDLPHTDGLERVEASHRVVSLNLLTLTWVLCTLDVEVRLESIDSHACDRLVAQASEDVDHILTTHIMFVPI